MVDDPSIPMLRLERLMQRNLTAEGDFSRALTRQIALFPDVLSHENGSKEHGKCVVGVGAEIRV